MSLIDETINRAEKAEKLAREYAKDVQRLAREREQALQLCSELDVVRAKLAIARATLADMRVKLAALQADYNALIKEKAA